MDSQYLDKNKRIWANNEYYDMAESFMNAQWESMIWPKIKDFDFSVTVDLACGHGRNTNFLLPLSKTLYAIDICQENVDFCEARFEGRGHIICKTCDGSSIPIRNSLATTLYVFDAAVHFAPEVIEKYLIDAHRVLKKGGMFFIHHSNYAGPYNEDWRYNPHARNQMTQEMFKSMVDKAKLNIVSQEIISWGEGATFVKDLDCISILSR